MRLPRFAMPGDSRPVVPNEDENLFLKLKDVADDGYQYAADLRRRKGAGADQQHRVTNKNLVRSPGPSGVREFLRTFGANAATLSYLMDDDGPFLAQMPDPSSFTIAAPEC